MTRATLIQFHEEQAARLRAEEQHERDRAAERMIQALAMDFLRALRRHGLRSREARDAYALLTATFGPMTHAAPVTYLRAATGQGGE